MRWRREGGGGEREGAKLTQKGGEERKSVRKIARDLRREERERRERNRERERREREVIK